MEHPGEGQGAAAPAIQPWKDIYAANPWIELFQPDGVAEESFYAADGAPGRAPGGRPSCHHA